MALVREMCQFMGKPLDNELDYLVPVLAKKSGENSGNFLSMEADQVLGLFTQTLTDTRVLSALIPPAR
jgi:hypothetical protein